jgi:hypothetical protein
MSKPDEKALREHVLFLLRGGGAHVGFDSAIENFPAELRAKRPAGAAHSGWEVLEHMRIAQWDIVEFCRNPEHVSPKFPDGYWPGRPAPRLAKEWDDSVKSFHEDLAAMCALVEKGDLFARIPGGDGQTLLREALLVADHNAYHLGEMVALRRSLGAWE